MITLSRFEGALCGLAIGDAWGAPFEGGLLERLIWHIIGRTWHGKKRWTDDTQMSLDLASSLIAQKRIDQDDLARRFAAGYRWSRGYGRGTASVLKKIKSGNSWKHANRSIFSNGSFGNGAAMRAAVIGLYHCKSVAEIDRAVRLTSEITHSHPLAIDGARLIAHAVAESVAGLEVEEIWKKLLTLEVEAALRQKLRWAYKASYSGHSVELSRVRECLGNGMAAIDSVPTSIYLALTTYLEPLSELLDRVIKIGGDTDTIGAMAGSIWGALRGREALPVALCERVEKLEQIRETAKKLFELATGV